MNVLALLVLAFAAIFLLGANLIHSSSSSASQPPAPSLQIGAFAAAIARAEGSNPDWNNPGDLTVSFGYPTLGTVNADGVLKFQNLNDGWNALYQQLQAIVNGNSRYSLTNDTIATFGAGYSGGDSNWAVNVASILGVAPNTPLSEVLS